MNTMTSAEYVANGGICCPFCGSTDIEGGGVDIDVGGASQAIFCNECEAEWTDHYTLSGYST